MKRDIVAELTAENEELYKKLSKLIDFINSDIFSRVSDISEKLLIAQSTAMATYSNILVARIELYENENSHKETE